MTPIQQVLSEFSGPLTGNPDAVTSLREWQVKAMVEEIERLKTVEKEGDELKESNNQVSEQWKSASNKLLVCADQLSQLRTAYKEALEDVKKAQRNYRIQYAINVGGLHNMETPYDKSLTNPLAIEVMKEKKV